MKKEAPLNRSQIMARIKGKDTEPELLVRSALHKSGLRFRINYKTPAGRVDIAFPKEKVAIQIDGCFWHSCPWHGAKPKTNPLFWIPKLDGNRARDRRQKVVLKGHGWILVRFWEHQVYRSLGAILLKIRYILGTRSGRV